MSVFALRSKSPFRRIGRRRSAIFGVLLVLAVGATACLPGVVDVPTSGQSYGKGPLDAIRDAADRTTSTGPYSQCGLTSVELAVMMMVPTYFEAGGPVPSPMALSRWDNMSVSASNATLFAFGQTTGPYVNAFFSPGIGLWQFDSAGGWDLTAADAIDAVTSSNAAASTIAYRFCNAPDSRRGTPELRRSYAWGPWFGCSAGASSVCESRYQQLVTEGKINSGQDATVDRSGGMSSRTCTVAGLGTNLPCWYVNPANAQGSRGWTSGTYDPTRPNYVTPLPKPFYVLRANGREYRIWLAADTGYDIGITASKPVTTNARTSLVWERSAALCDLTTMRGVCGATSPVGFLDSVEESGSNRVRVRGWAFDRDTQTPLALSVSVGSAAQNITTQISRADVAAVIPGAPGNSGFDVTINATPGTQNICVTALDVGGPGVNTNLGCRSVLVSGVPLAFIDGTQIRPGAIDVWGWGFLPGDASASIALYVDGQVAGRVSRTVARPDVLAVFSGAELVTGFSGTATSYGGSHTVCVGLNALPAMTVGCRQVTLSGGSPTGFLDSVTRTSGGIAVNGWAIDPDTAASVDIHVYVNGVNTLASASGSRPDVGAAMPGYGNNHGFAVTVPARGNSSDVCVYGINVGVGVHVLLGCRKV
ncbi:MAG: hypothetical protein NT081_09220 [Actinobacteria bacterium]|nr:hypothetical protein [Actinomycetota bacterium]